MISFILAEMTYLRYFVPLMVEAKKRGIETQTLVGKNTKYNDPFKYKEYLKEMATTHHTKLVEWTPETVSGTLITVEGAGAQNMKGNIVSLVAMADFRLLYDNYINQVDYVIFPSRFFAEFYGKVSPKNLFLGSPKYDVHLEGGLIRKKYGFSHEDKIVTVFAPNIQERRSIDLKKINNMLSSFGYKVVIKTRGKHIVDKGSRGDVYFEDFSWHPHASLELIEISDFIVNFDSSTIKESTMLKTPVINFNIRGDQRRLPFLYEPSFCVESNIADLQRSVDVIRGSDYRKDFQDAKEKYLFQEGNVSQKILDAVL